MFKFKVNDEWLKRAAEAEADHDISAGGHMSDERFEKFQEAVKDGNVVILGEGATDEDLVLTDCTGSLVHFVSETNWSEDAFCLRVSDGGGFTGLLLTKERWEEFKAKVDRKLEEKSGKGNP